MTQKLVTGSGGESATRARRAGHDTSDLRPALVVGGGAAVAAVAGLATTALIGRWLEPVEAGRAFAGLALAGTAFGLLSALRGRASLAVARAGSSGAAVGGRQRRIAAVAAAGVTAIGIPVALQAHGWLGFPVAAPLVAVVVLLAGKTVLEIERGVLIGLGRARDHALGTGVEALLRLVVAVALLRSGGSATAALAAYVVGCAGALLWRGPVARDGAAWTAPVTAAGRGGALGAHAVAVAVLAHADVLAAQVWLAPTDAASYAAAATLARSVALVALPAQTLVLPAVARAVARRETPGPVVLRLAGLTLAAAALPVGVAALTPDAVLSLVYGRAAGAGLVLPLQVVGQVLLQLSSLAVLGAIAAGRRGLLPGLAASAGWTAVVLGSCAAFAQPASLAAAFVGIQGGVLAIVTAVLVGRSAARHEASRCPS